MHKDSIQKRNTLLRHRLISFLRDIDVKGIRRLSVILPRILLPSPEVVGRHIRTTLHGYDLLIDPKVDRGVELSIHETGTYEKGVVSFIEKYMDPKGMLIDVGANIGHLSIFTAVKFPESKIHSFEPHPKTREILEFNIGLNKCRNISVHSEALGNEVGEAFIYDNWQVNRGGASLIVKDDTEGSRVQLRPLDDCSFQQHATILKIDVEGFELTVLEGAKALIQSNRPILIVEISGRGAMGCTPEEIFKFIQSLNDYRIFKLKGGKERRSELIEIVSNSELPQHDNLFCLPKD